MKWKEVVEACFKALSQNWQRDSGKTQKFHSVCPIFRAKNRIHDHSYAKNDTDICSVNTYKELSCHRVLLSDPMF